MEHFRKILESALNGMKLLGGASVAGMMLLTCADVIGRYFGRPILGSVEIVGILSVLTATFALPYTHQAKAHIGVDMFVKMLPPKAQTVIDLCTHGLGCILFSVITWRMVAYGITILNSGQVTMNLKIPEYLMIFVAAICFFVFACQILFETILLFKRLKTHS